MRKNLLTLYPFTALILGLILAQILGTIQVYLSNTDLYVSLVAIKDAGYLIIPNQKIMSRLQEFGPAFSGGLFFAFSLGAGISFFSLALAWIWDRLFSRRRYLIYLFLSGWFGCLLVLNFSGFKLFNTLYFLVIPPAVFLFAIRYMPPRDNRTRRPHGIFHIIPVMVLAFLLSWQIDQRMFTDFRDIFLLSNPVGSKINRFYYNYTLYAAEAFKSLDQKMLKTYKLEKIENTAVARSLEKILINRDYIPIAGNIPVDLKITQIDDAFSFENRGNDILRKSLEDFFSDPGTVIKEFAAQSDANAFFRRIIFFSLLTGFPIAVYVILHGLISITLSLYFSRRTSAGIASILCFVFSLILILAFQLSRSRDVSEENLANALNSDRRQKRVAALKLIDEKKLGIKRFQAYPKLLASPYIAERYWLVRVLAGSRNPATYGDLLNYLNDPHPNVRSMAYYALGKRRNRRAIGHILNKIETSDNWYSQWYAYKALRSLGWKQTKLN